MEQTLLNEIVARVAAKLAESRRRETEAVLQADTDMRRRFHADA